MSRSAGSCAALPAVGSRLRTARRHCAASPLTWTMQPGWRARSARCGSARIWRRRGRRSGMGCPEPDLHRTPGTAYLFVIIQFADYARTTTMAGHSQFKNIMHRKGRQDAVKSKLFGKLAREITVSAKLGVPDPGMNARLRAAILAARAENMPKDNIDRAIKKALGADAENYEEIRYEGFGPGGVAVIVEVLTDNRNRAASEVRASFTKSGGNLAETGAVSFMFAHVGLIEYDAAVASADAMLDAAIEAGADDAVSEESGHEIYASAESFRDVAKALEQKFG